MSRRYDIINDIAIWCAKRELPQKEVIDLIHDVLDSAGQSDYNCNDESSVAEELNSIERSVVPIYARVIGYKAPTLE